MFQGTMLIMPVIVGIIVFIIGFNLISKSNQDERDGQCRSKGWAKGVGIFSMIWFGFIVISVIAMIYIMRKTQTI
ncbi:hypothetical protein QKU48_gp0696 [Fadolivirus algeromassiliense]|jgi:xanthine/uracil permease|uniref:Uncharacterized protein n=1 Tax=Fadolivirus FV1/VV64 TaxID=3070911 RepID=A0A7D3UVM2_9VIRU|nr:hypothetical protein QKU48_gp0696 [Fadolivirus algeromassiliense]QKF94154.1 hypothetical protein Fadolivirus_1_696 [Fadolivirus FV1/VV64]